MLASRVLKTVSLIHDVKSRFHEKKTLTMSDGVWLRNRMQDMGPTYIKVGQFMSARRDIFDKNITDALKSLQDKVDPIDTNTIKSLIGERAVHFSSIERIPIASASIGQVHRARLRQDKDRMVVFKVKRPGIEEAICNDVGLIITILEVLRFLGTPNVTESLYALEDFRDCLLEEASYTNEIMNIKLFASSNITNIRDDVIVPGVINELSSNDLIVMDYEPACKISDVKHGMMKKQRSELAFKLMDVFVMSLITSGVIHGDPHEGNIGIRDDKIVLYDYGSVITISSELKSQMKQLVFELMTENIDAAMDVIKRMNVITVRDEAALKLYLEKYILYFKTLDVNVFKFSKDENYKDLPVKFDGVIFRLIRAFGMIEGICKDLDPEFNYNTVFMKYVDILIVDPAFIKYKMRSDVGLVFRYILKMMD